jgi:polysaccharide pyruvyl transferase WcaK-like protein
MSDLLIVGYFGAGNTGDDLILDTFLSLIRGKVPHSRIYVLSSCQSSSALSAYPGIIPVPRTAIIRIAWIMLTHAHLKVIAPGGELFQMRSSYRSLLYYCMVFLTALLLKRPYYLLHQGIDPSVFQGFLAGMTRMVLGHAAFLSVRDSCIAGFTQAVNVPDIVFLRKSTLPLKMNRGSRFFAFVLRPSGSRIDALVQALIGGLRKKFPEHLFVFLPFHRIQDWSFNLECSLLEPGFLSRFAGGTDSNQVQDLISGADFALCMRYHAVILSMLANVPFLSLSGDGRQDLLCRSFDMGFSHLKPSDMEGSNGIFNAVERISSIFKEKRLFQGQITAFQTDLMLSLDGILPVILQ